MIKPLHVLTLGRLRKRRKLRKSYRLRGAVGIESVRQAYESPLPSPQAVREIIKHDSDKQDILEQADILAEEEREFEQDESLRARVAAHEGRRRFLYKDTLGVWTIGIGYNIQDRGLPDDIIDELFRRTLVESIDECEEIFGKTFFYGILPEDVREVMVEACFQLGKSRFLKFRKMIAAVKRQDYREAARQMRDSRWYKQTTRRVEKLATIVETYA